MEQKVSKASDHVKPNFHAHIIWDWMDHTTGKSWKLNEKDMSEMQTLVAKTLGMERGTSKAETQTAEFKEECEHLEEEVEQAKHRKEREKSERYNAILDSVIADGRKAQREFALSTRSGSFNDNEAGRVYYALVALATEDNISLQTEFGIKNVGKRFLDGCDWSKMSETRIMTHKGWTNMFATRNANFEQSNIDTFLSAVDKMSCSAENYVSLMGSNGCADQLTNWDGSKKPGLAAPEKKKGGGMSR